ncbi:hypothetical protein G7Y89_g7161 [Cudoniella acicularis]|uniref:Apple domain-containing protein n=1 Tax=Cudoniella acicularis TaxID=354080 RepID=A0A8H4W1T0_9HELO|nr:hypothetical protein G7Y89_g7161 [Cudoniella acicularis]
MVSTSAILSVVSPFLLAALLPLAANAQAALTCGVLGWDALGAAPAFYAVNNPASATPAACKKLCQTPSITPKCASFAVGNSSCLLYTNSAANQVNANTGSLYAYYDVNCAVPAAVAFSA